MKTPRTTHQPRPRRAATTALMTTTNEHEPVIAQTIGATAVGSSGQRCTAYSDSPPMTNTSTCRRSGAARAARASYQTL